MVEVIKGFDIEIDKNEVYHYLGYRKDRGPRSSIASLIDEEMNKAYELIQPWCFYQFMDIKRVRKPRVVLQDNLVITSGVLSQVLHKCHRVAIFMATIGNRLEDRVAQLMSEGQMLRATVLDALGSEAAEKTVGYLQKRVSDFATAEGAAITLRYSPGYCDWDITQQQVLFGAVDSALLAVNLTQECLMVPRKSVSGIIGLGRVEKRLIKRSPCRLCDKMDCQIRR